MKTIRKVGKIFTLLLLVLTTVISGLVQVEAAPATIQLGSRKNIPALVGDQSMATKTLADGSPVYCVDLHDKTPSYMEMTLVGLKDAGYAYLIENGYPYKHFTGNDDYDYYITQIAVWWYMDETEGTNRLSDSVKSTGQDPYNLRQYIIKLKDGAITAKNKGYATPSIKLSTGSVQLSLTEDKEYYMSEEIAVKGNHIGDYKVTLDQVPEGTMILDQDGKVRDTFKVTEKFRVRVPVSSIDDFKVNLKISVSATGTVNKAYMYKPADESYQRVVPSILYPETSTVKDSLTLYVATSKVSILKIDSETLKPLAGATLVLKNDAGEELYRWVSTEEAYVIKDLEYGVYIIEEEKAPDGYMKSDEIYMFTIDEENPSYKLEVKNFKEIEVPNTNSSASIMMYSIGAVILTAGIGLVYYYGKKQQAK